MRRRLGLLGLLALLALLVGLGLPAALAHAQATFNTEVEPGRWKALRVRNLPQGSILSVNVRLEGEIVVAVVSGPDYARFKTVTRPLFRGHVRRKLSFSVTVPATGHYYVVLDNREGTERRSVQLSVNARRGRSAPRPTPAPAPAPQERTEERAIPRTA